MSRGAGAGRAAVVGLLACLAGCASPLPAERVAGAVADALEAQLGFRPEVRCPDDVEAEVGAKARCTAAVDGETYGATVTVTAVDGDEAAFDVRIDGRPAG